MTASGVIQGLDWANGRPFVESLIGIKPDMLARLIGGSLMAVIAFRLKLESRDISMGYLASAPCAAHAQELVSARELPT